MALFACKSCHWCAEPTGAGAGPLGLLMTMFPGMEAACRTALSHANGDLDRATEMLITQSHAVNTPTAVPHPAPRVQSQQAFAASIEPRRGSAPRTAPSLTDIMSEQLVDKLQQDTGAEHNTATWARIGQAGRVALQQLMDEYPGWDMCGAAQLTPAELPRLFVEDVLNANSGTVARARLVLGVHPPSTAMDPQLQHTMLYRQIIDRVLQARARASHASLTASGRRRGRSRGRAG